MVGPARFERATLCLEGRCSIQLSYGPVYLFYQRNRKPQTKLCNIVAGEAHAYTFTWIVMSGKFSPLTAHVRCCGAKYLSELRFHSSDARQSKTIYDIVLVIDAYCLFQVITPEMPCIHAGRFSSRERLISEPCISR